MPVINWIHLSDWHEGNDNNNPERAEVRSSLITDIIDREEIDSRIKKIDLLIVSGDIAYSGKRHQYDAAEQNFIAPIMNACYLEKSRVVISPGNHDIDWDRLKAIDQNIWKPFFYNTTSEKKAHIDESIANSDTLDTLLFPFQAFGDFQRKFLVNDTASYDKPAYFVTHNIKIDGISVAIVSLNSAWLAGRNKDISGHINDYGFLSIGRKQIYDAI